jgi:probable HAF family extracellular repeat protein
VDLGTLGGARSEALGVNLLGDVVGSSTTADGASHAFLYRDGRMFDLGTLPGGTASRATDITDGGAIVGDSGINAYGPQFREFTQGFIWQGGAMRALGALYCPCTFNSRYGTSRALAVNGGGRIVGDSLTNRQALAHAFVWQADAMRDVGNEIDGASSSAAYDINEADEIVGEADGHAFFMTCGLIQDLGALPGHATSSACAVNDVGQVAGNSVAADGVSHAFLWELGAMRSLGPLPRDMSSEARAINVTGQVVGRSGTADLSTSRAVLWQGGAAIDLNSLITVPGWTLSDATDINDVRQIVGIGLRNGQLRAFLLNPR